MVSLAVVSRDIIQSALVIAAMHTIVEPYMYI